MNLASSSLLGPKLGSVSSEVIDGEAIIMNHDTGVYFNSMGSGALVWQAITAVRTLDEIVAYVAGCFGTDPATVAGSVTDFVATLQQNELLEVSSQQQRSELAVERQAQAYAPPQIESHTDLADLLLLDPVHVAPMASWPSPNNP